MSGRPAQPTRGSGRGAAGPVLITGGAGFIGTNLADRLMSDGTPVIVYDNLSRPGVERNLRWLQQEHPDLLQIEIADVRDRKALRHAVGGADRVVHLAAQVAVTTSLQDPAHDFDVNATGTLNLLTALRDLEEPPPLLFTSTNKVYGGLDDITLELDGRRYEPVDPTLRSCGIGEDRPLDFHSPYGCSKGAADQYVIDYARTFGLRTVVFRMSCIYGPHQCGTEDQGWVAHFLLRALNGQSITLFGDGQQVRDILFVDDLVNAVQLAFDNIDNVSGRAFNMGGGPGRTTSLLELCDRIDGLCDEAVSVQFADWRPGDQRYYVSDTRLFSEVTGWRPRVNVGEGVTRLHEWLIENDISAAAPAASARGRDWLEHEMGQHALAAGKP